VLRQFIQFIVRHLCCDHKRRVLAMIVREPVTYSRRAQYYCPECQHSWHSWKLPEGI
jgi:hypothetical protein